MCCCLWQNTTQFCSYEMSYIILLFAKEQVSIRLNLTLLVHWRRLYFVLDSINPGCQSHSCYKIGVRHATWNSVLDKSCLHISGVKTWSTKPHTLSPGGNKLNSSNKREINCIGYDLSIGNSPWRWCHFAIVLSSHYFKESKSWFDLIATNNHINIAITITTCEPEYDHKCEAVTAVHQRKNYKIIVNRLCGEDSITQYSKMYLPYLWHDVVCNFLK